jgi:hypothetical protein
MPKRMHKQLILATALLHGEILIKQQRGSGVASCPFLVSSHPRTDSQLNKESIYFLERKDFPFSQPPGSSSADSKSFEILLSRGAKKQGPKCISAHKRAGWKVFFECLQVRWKLKARTICHSMAHHLGPREECVCDFWAVACFMALSRSLFTYLAATSILMPITRFSKRCHCSPRGLK